MGGGREPAAAWAGRSDGRRLSECPPEGRRPGNAARSTPPRGSARPCALREARPATRLTRASPMSAPSPAKVSPSLGRPPLRRLCPGPRPADPRKSRPVANSPHNMRNTFPRNALCECTCIPCTCISPRACTGVTRVHAQTTCARTLSMPVSSVSGYRTLS